MRFTCLFLSSALLMAQSPDDSAAKIFLEGIQHIENRNSNLKADFDIKGTIYKRAMELDSNTASPRTRLSAASWLLRRNMSMGFSYSGKQSYLQAARNQPDLQKAWDLLTSPIPESEARQQAELELEIAWRLVDLEKMRSAYNKVSKQAELDPRELTHCFMVAAHLGEWDALKNFAEMFRKHGADLRGFHEAALNNLSSFDYESLLHAVEVGKPTTESLQMVLQSFRIKNWRCHINSLSGSNSELVKPLAEQLKAAPKGWFDHAESMVLLVQVGAASHWVESYAQPPVSGSIDKNRIFLAGYRDTKDQKGQSARQNDIWEMKPDPARPGYWVGTNKMIVPATGPTKDSLPALQLVMDHEWELVQQDKF